MEENAFGPHARGTSLVTSWLRRTAADMDMDLDPNSASSVLAVLHEIDHRLAVGEDCIENVWVHANREELDRRANSDGPLYTTEEVLAELEREER